MIKNLIGKRSEKVENVVERGAVKKFAESIGDPHPIYTDKDYAKQTVHKENIAPPTFTRTFDYGQIEGLHLPSAGLIHGGQTFEYLRPLLVGETLYCFSKVENYMEKEAHSGSLGFLTIINVGESATENIIFTERIVIILTEAIRKEIQNAELAGS